MTITEFLDNEVVDFASYSTLRAIASLVDGLKNSHRKVVYYMQNNGHKEKKVANLAGETMTSTEYLHGDISGSIITLAQKYTGSNNIPLLTREGNFGSRFTPEASAIRYIYTMNESYFGDIFKKEDNNVLIQQEFEGTKIEPRFFVPTIPLILVNGSEGIATGFAQKILPRKLDTIKEYITAYMEGNDLPELTPGYNGFNGDIEKGETPNQWLIKGKFERVTATKLMITEIPIGYTLTSYTKVLDDLEDKKVIKSYEDLSEDDNFKFEVSVEVKFTKGVADDVILDKLKLIKKVTENFTVIDEKNRIANYTSPEEVLNHYIEIKLEFLQARKDFLVQSTKQDLLLLASKYLFVRGVTQNEIVVNNKKKTEIAEQLDEIDKIIKDEGSYDYLLRMSIYSLTEEKMKELQEKIKQQKEELEIIEKTSIEKTWQDELNKI
jgi:DNA topoisomerase-2